MAIFFFLFALVEVIRIGYSGRQYFSQFGSYIRLATIAFLFPTLLLKLETEHLSSLSALAMFFGWSQVTFCVGQHPELGLYQFVFAAAAMRFLKIFGVLFFCFVGFAVSLFVFC